MAFGLYVSLVPKARIGTQVIAALGYKNPQDQGLGGNGLFFKDEWEEKFDTPCPLIDDEYVYYYHLDENAPKPAE